MKTLEQPDVTEAARRERRRSPEAPTPGWVVPTHIVAASLISSTWFAVQFMLPVLAVKRFNATSWQTVLVTAAPMVLSVLSIFWNAALSGRRLPSYLAGVWLLMGLPLAAIGFADDYWHLLVPQLIACIGFAGYHPVAGDLLRTLYPERSRGRVYSWVWGASMCTGAAAGFAMGRLLEQDADAFRVIMPVAAGLQLAGVVVLMWLSHRSGHNAARNARLDLSRTGPREPMSLRRLLEPIVHMGGILRADPVFARYEAAFMTYGVGWMIVTALMPLVITKGLHLGYDRMAECTYVPYWLAMTVMIVPAGMLMDRLGVARSTALSFLLLAGHPLAVVLAILAGPDGYWVLLAASTYYGLAHAGANVGWMLGPVSLAPSPEKVPQYVAIHSTMVGIRGSIFQALGVGLYQWSNSFTLPLSVAAAAYAWSAWQMWGLRGRIAERSAGTR